MSRRWLDKFLESEKITKIAMTKRAGYIEHLVRMFEGKAEKFSSVEDALSDFSSRLGLSGTEMGALVREAQVIVKKKVADRKTDLNDLPEAALRSKQKNNTIAPNEAKPLLNQKKKQKEIEAPADTVDLDEDGAGNELSNALVQAQNKLKKKKAQKFDFDPSKLSMPDGAPQGSYIKKIRKELGGKDQDDFLDTYKKIRFGYRFGTAHKPQQSLLEGSSQKSMKYNPPEAGTPVKVECSRYDNFGDKVDHKIEIALLKELNEELQVDSFIDKLNEIIEKYPNHPVVSSAVDLRSDFETIRSRFDPTSPNKMEIDRSTRAKRSATMRQLISALPRKYQNKALKILALGQFKDMKFESKQLIGDTKYIVGSFLMMNDFFPFTGFAIESGNPEPLQQALLGRESISKDELLALAEEHNVNLKPKGSADSSTTFTPLPNQRNDEGEVFSIEITDLPTNPNYKPTILSAEEIASADAPRKMRKQIFTAILGKAPFAYHPTTTGVKPMSPFDMAESDDKIKADIKSGNKRFEKRTHEDYTSNNLNLDGEGELAKTSNPHFGMHPSVDLGQKADGTPRSYSEYFPKKKLRQNRQKFGPTGKISLAIPGITKIASAEMLMSDKGEMFTSEAEMLESFMKDLLASDGLEFIENAANKAMGSLETTTIPLHSESPELPPQIEPEKEPEVEVQEKEDEYALVASINTLLTKVSENTRQRLEQKLRGKK